MSCYSAHRRKRAKRYGSFFSARVEPENDVGRLSDIKRERRDDYRRGMDNEHRLFEAFTSGEFPGWFVSIRPATEAEDHLGVDAWVSTTDGDVAVQVKSSALRASEFRAKRPDYQGVVVVVHQAMPDEQIRETVLKDVHRVLWKKGKAA